MLLHEIIKKHSEVWDLAIQLMTANNANRNLIAEGWKFDFNSRKGAFGICAYRSRTISYSVHYLTEPMEVIRETILHEMAHAIAGPGTNHGPVWRRWARVLGINPERTGQPTVETSFALAAKAKYVGVCQVCNFHQPFHRKLNRSYLCPTCHGKYQHNRLTIVQQY